MTGDKKGPVRAMVEQLGSDSNSTVVSLDLNRLAILYEQAISAADELDAKLAYDKREAQRAAFHTGYAYATRAIAANLDEAYPAIPNPDIWPPRAFTAAELRALTEVMECAERDHAERTQ